MENDALNTVIDILIDYGMSEEDTVNLLTRLIKEESDQLARFKNMQQKFTFSMVIYPRSTLPPSAYYW